MDMIRIEVIEAANKTALEQCYRIRKVVFCDEQNVPANLEWDGLDDHCSHYLLFADGIPVATARVREYRRGIMKIERVAALKQYRGLGLGLALMKQILTDLAAGPATEVILNAQVAVETFYAALGFQPIGDRFAEAGIPHIRMRLPLKS